MSLKELSYSSDLTDSDFDFTKVGYQYLHSFDFGLSYYSYCDYLTIYFDYSGWIGDFDFKLFAFVKCLPLSATLNYTFLKKYWLGWFKFYSWPT